MNKVKLMNEISRSFSLYGASKWLSKERPELDNQSPADLIKENNLKPVYTLLKKDLKK
tara:strand:+ start:774 stop:947 length:174 start_codon:yes stop_codon:yes gene_type:complete